MSQPSPPLARYPDPQSAGTVIVGMSGGVDSAVAALLLQRGPATPCRDCSCPTGRTRTPTARPPPIFRMRAGCAIRWAFRCTGSSFAGEYRERVFAHFLDEYAAGRTPNPDVLCNREIKFGVCLDYMRRLGAAWIATGHYARIDASRRVPGCSRQRTAAKDQSYFLHAVDAAGARPDSVSRSAAAQGRGAPAGPRGGIAGVRQAGQHRHLLHRRAALSRNFSAAICRRRRARSRPRTDAIVGEHRGLPFHTLGQRSGLGLGGRPGAAAAPWYVADKDVRAQCADRRAGPGPSAAAVEMPSTSRELHWLARAAPAGARIACARSRPATGRRDLPCRCIMETRQQARVVLNRAGARRDAGPVRGVLRRRAVPRRRRDRTGTLPLRSPARRR